MKTVTRLLLILPCLAAAADPARGTTINKVPGNDSIGSAQNLDGLFSLDFNPDIGDINGTNTSLTLPHATVLGFGDNTFDYYSFTVAFPNTLGIFDIDHTSAAGGQSLDLELFLFALDGTLLAQNDDFSPVTAGAGGSISTEDPFIQHTFTDPGRYVIGVGRFNSIALPTGIGGSEIKPGDQYTLHVSVPEPATAISAIAALLGVWFCRRRLFRSV